MYQTITVGIWLHLAQARKKHLILAAQPMISTKTTVKVVPRFFVYTFSLTKITATASLSGDSQNCMYQDGPEERAQLNTTQKWPFSIHPAQHCRLPGSIQTSQTRHNKRKWVLADVMELYRETFHARWKERTKT